MPASATPGKYDSYEGRTTITPMAARQAGIKVETAGPATFDQTVELTGQVELAPAAQSEVGARFPGRVMAVMRNVGDRVGAGTVLARVESSESLQTYSVTSPRAGIVLERRTNVGDVTGSEPIFIIGDPSDVYAAFPVYPRDMERVRPGQPVIVQSLAGDRSRATVIRDFLPLANASSQTVTARAPLPNPDGFWRAGMGVKGQVTVSRRQVPLAVKTSALQAFRDFTVVFAKVGNSYEVRMLELGQQTPEWTEVLSGIKPGQAYVTEGSFVIKADIEKSGASHDH
jgi:membrane fusion protein, heavy metal efflux system